MVTTDALRRPPLLFDSWPEADAAFEQFEATIPERRVQLRERIKATDGPVLDGTAESLVLLGAWFTRVALEDEDDGMDWRPVWLPERNPDWVPNPIQPRAVSDQLHRLQELVGVYVGDVTMAEVPHARWVCWRADSNRLLTSGLPVVDMGVKEPPMNAIYCGPADILRAYIFEGTGGRDDYPADPTYLAQAYANTLAKRDEALDGGRPTWQRAPTGPDAHRRTVKPTW